LAGRVRLVRDFLAPLTNQPQSEDSMRYIAARSLSKLLVLGALAFFGVFCTGILPLKSESLLGVIALAVLGIALRVAWWHEV
jgi:hypothetical protein